MFGEIVEEIICANNNSDFRSFFERNVGKNQRVADSEDRKMALKTYRWKCITSLNRANFSIRVWTNNVKN